ncbi:MAG: glycosyltransferase [Magnetovibrio sp.]|nr:glycosyltransferase [Magnetovibrio sp.]|tara:strand:+ start:133 stop:828 length:696 start_codon:yes stop_codon:yes gene_type:complete
MTISLSVIMPTYNEELTILEILNLVKAQENEVFSMEVIVVDDGSTDQTIKLLEANTTLYSKLIKLSENSGKGAAVKAGLSAANGEYILFQDADLEYLPSEYPKLMRPVLEFKADLVMSSRFAAPEINRVAYFWNKVGNRLITLFFNILNNTTFTDIYSCYMLFRRDLVPVNKLKNMGWGQHAEILSIARKHAKNIYEVPISYHGRSLEEGKKIRAYHVIDVFWTILIQRFF